jgi:hypothetical protein
VCGEASPGGRTRVGTGSGGDARGEASASGTVWGGGASRSGGGKHREATPSTSNVADDGSGSGMPRSPVRSLASFFIFLKSFTQTG